MATGKSDDPPLRIDSTFRNGSVTAIGVVLGFSLGFLSHWVEQPGGWEIGDFVAVIAMTVGIGLQIVSVAQLLSVNSLFLSSYNRSVVIFIVGLVLVSLGVATAILLQIIWAMNETAKP
jgi:hypothetical protein